MQDVGDGAIIISGGTSAELPPTASVDTISQSLTYKTTSVISWPATMWGPGIVMVLVVPLSVTGEYLQN